MDFLGGLDDSGDLGLRIGRLELWPLLNPIPFGEYIHMYCTYIFCICDFMTVLHIYNLVNVYVN